MSQAYTEFDRERYLLDRSQNIASSEMTALNTAGVTDALATAAREGLDVVLLTGDNEGAAQAAATADRPNSRVVSFIVCLRYFMNRARR